MMITYDILLGLILQYQVSTTVMDLVVVSASFVFMLALLRCCVVTVFSVNKDLYNGSFRGACVPGGDVGGAKCPSFHGAPRSTGRREICRLN